MSKHSASVCGLHGPTHLIVTFSCLIISGTPADVAVLPSIKKLINDYEDKIAELGNSTDDGFISVTGSVTNLFSPSKGFSLL